MDTRSIAHLSGLLLALLAPPALAGETLRFEVAPQTKLRRVVSASHELALDELGWSRDGGPVVSDQSAGWVSTWQRIEVVDEIQESGGGRPLSLRRTFADIGAGGKATLTRADMPKFEEKSVSFSPLRDQTLVFTWVEDEGDWSRAYERIHAEEEWLAGVRGDMDFLGLLPAGPVEPGDTWELELESLRDVLAPGGNLLLTPRGGSHFGRSMEIGVGGDFAEILGQEIFGSAVATYGGTREVDGRTLGVIRLELEIATETDRTDMYRESMPREEKKEPSELERADLQYALKGEGELLWDMEAGHFRSFHLTGHESFAGGVHKIAAEGLEPFRISQVTRVSGQVDLKVEATEVEEEEGAPETGSSPDGGKQG